MPEPEPTTELRAVPSKDSSLSNSTTEGERRDLPPAKMIERFTAMMGMAQIVDPLMGKLDGKHLTAVISNADKADERRHEQEKQRSWYQFLGLCVIVVSVLLLCGLFLAYGKSEHLNMVLGLIVGLAGGFGLGKNSKRSE